MTVTALANYQDRLAGLPPENFVGSLLWYTIAGTEDPVTGEKVPVRTTSDQLEAWFHELGLDPKFLPPRILKIDAFRNATTPVKREYDLPDGNKAELAIEEIDANDDYVLRHVIRTVRDPRRQRDEDKLQTEFMATLKFFRGGRNSQQKRAGGDNYKSRPKPGLAKVDRDQVESMLAEVEDRYTDLSANLNEPKLRSVIRNYLIHLNSIAVKPQAALYFVHSQHQKAVDALQPLVQRFGAGCAFEQVPLIKTEESKGMLTEAFQREVVADVDKLMAKIAETNKAAAGGKVSSKKYAEINALYQEVASRSEEHTRTLGLAMGKAASALELALDNVMDMASRIEFQAKAKSA